jgi:hypothetical protein
LVLQTELYNNCVEQGNDISIIADASTYIKDLKQKIAKLNQEIARVQDTNNAPLVSVEALEKGFLINVCVDKSGPGLLASILEAFDEVGLTVLEVRASCAGAFLLEAVGGEVRICLKLHLII